MEPEDEAEEELEADRKSDQYVEDEDEDHEPGNMTREADPNSRADKACPCGGLRNYWQERCDCGMGMHWPVEGDECLEGLVKCAGYKENRWRSRRNRRKNREEVKEEPCESRCSPIEGEEEELEE